MQHSYENILNCINVYCRYTLSWFSDLYVDFCHTVTSSAYPLKALKSFISTRYVHFSISYFILNQYAPKCPIMHCQLLLKKQKNDLCQTRCGHVTYANTGHHGNASLAVQRVSPSVCFSCFIDAFTLLLDFSFVTSSTSIFGRDMQQNVSLNMASLERERPQS